VTRPIGTHSATRMSPLSSQIASCGWMNLPGMNFSRGAPRRSLGLPSQSCTTGLLEASTIVTTLSRSGTSIRSPRTFMSQGMRMPSVTNPRCAPSSERYWIRRLPRSATASAGSLVNAVPRRSTVMPCGQDTSPGLLPGRATMRFHSPAGENAWMKLAP